MIDSDEDDLSLVLDLTLKKKQPKIVEPLSKPQAKIARVVKRPAALTIMEPNPKELSKIASARVESKNSSPGVEGDRVKSYITLFFRLIVFYHFD